MPAAKTWYKNARGTRATTEKRTRRSSSLHSDNERTSVYFTVCPLALNCLMASRNSAARS